MQQCKIENKPTLVGVLL